MKIVFNDAKTGNCFQKEVDKAREAQLYGKRIGEEIDGGLIGLDGYKLKITGGSSKDGTPMRREISGQRKIVALLCGGVGIRGLGKGARRKKTVFGNTVSPEIFQLNTVVAAAGSKPLGELGFTPKAKESKAEGGGKKEGKPKEGKKEEKQKHAEVKKEEAKTEKAEKPGHEEKAEEKPKREAGGAEEKKAEEKPKNAAEEPKREAPKHEEKKE